jgi:hypothetical protein
MHCLQRDCSGIVSTEWAGGGFEEKRVNLTKDI